jgi:hypothetical protein
MFAARATKVRAVLAARDITTQSALLGVAAGGGRLAVATLRPGQASFEPKSRGRGGRGSGLSGQLTGKRS